jgi:hypothetical protein
MSENNMEGADVALKVAGQEFNVRNVKSLNTLATVATLVVSVCGFTIGWFLLDAHAQGTSKRDDTLISVLKEQAIAQRITNCLMATPQDQRENKLATCERIAR